MHLNKPTTQTNAVQPPTNIQPSMYCPKSPRPFSAEFRGTDSCQVDVMLTGTWLEREKLLAGLFFLLLLLLLLPPPELTVLPPETFLFRLLFGACLAGSATTKKRD